MVFSTHHSSMARFLAAGATREAISRTHGWLRREVFSCVQAKTTLHHYSLTDEKYKTFTVSLEWRFPIGTKPTKDGVGLAL
jgi:hypothetical protein